MPDVPTDFKDDEIDDLKWAANQLGMTVDEFTTHAANRLVKNTKEDMRKRIESHKALKIIK